jgi:hypothetical protein
MAAMGDLMSAMEQMGQRIGGTSEAQVGEGRADAPVGTTLAMIDQATKVLNSVHKRMHAAQAQEFQLLTQCFREHPESFWQRKGVSNYPWDEKTFIEALDNCDLVPQADPNTASHGQRVMKVMGLIQLAQTDPTMFNQREIAEIALQTIGWSNPEQFLNAEGAQPQPTPEQMKDLATAQTDKTKADADMLRAQSDAKKIDGELKQGLGAQADTPVDQMTAQAKLMDAQTKKDALGLDARQNEVENQNRDQDRASHEKIALLDLAKEVVEKPEDASEAAREIPKVDKAAEER